MPLPWAGLLAAAAAKWLTRRAMRYGRHAHDSHRGRHERAPAADTVHNRAMTTPEDERPEPVAVDPAPDQAVTVKPAADDSDDELADDDDADPTT